MNQNCRQMPVANQCGPETLQEGQAKQACQPFDICLGFGRSLHFDGYCLSLKDDGKKIPDGTYGGIVVQNGCIVDAFPQPAVEYTPAPCAPASQPCGGGSGEGLVLQQNPCNLLTRNAAGQYGAFIAIENTDDVEWTGCGSASEPLRATLKKSGDGDKVYLGEGAGIKVSGKGSLQDAYIISLDKIFEADQNYGGFSVNAYGQITGYTKPADAAVKGLSEGPGIKLENNEGFITVSLSPYDKINGAYQVGGWEMNLDMYGRVKSMSRNITLPEELANTFVDPYEYAMAFNEYGSLIQLMPQTRKQDIQFSTMFTGTRDATKFTFTSKVSGNLRVVYRGTLPYTPTSSGGQTGFVDRFQRLPAPYRMTVDDQAVTAYALVANNQITEIHLLTERVYAAGHHVVELLGPNVTESSPYPFQDIAYMDVDIVEYV